jgi:hypothetical protein
VRPSVNPKAAAERLAGTSLMMSPVAIEFENSE